MPALLAAALALAVAADAPVDLQVRPGSTITYRLVHKLHEVEGVSRSVEGKARLLPGGTVQVMVRAPVASFDSGNGNRDAHMQEATEAHRFPHVTVKVVGTVALPATYPATVEVPLAGQLDFHGVARPVELKARVEFTGPGAARVEAGFTVSLDAHGVERPSLLFVKVEDALAVTASLVLAAEGP